MSKKIKTYEDGREYEIRQMVKIFIKAPPSSRLLIRDIYKYLSKRQGEIFLKQKIKK